MWELYVYGQREAFTPKWVSPKVFDIMFSSLRLSMVASLGDHYDRAVVRGGYVPVLTDGVRSAIDMPACRLIQSEAKARRYRDLRPTP